MALFAVYPVRIGHASFAGDGRNAHHHFGTLSDVGDILARVYSVMSCVTVKVPNAPVPFTCILRSGITSRSKCASFSRNQTFRNRGTGGAEKSAFSARRRQRRGVCRDNLFRNVSRKNQRPEPRSPDGASSGYSRKGSVLMVVNLQLISCCEYSDLSQDAWSSSSGRPYPTKLFPSEVH